MLLQGDIHINEFSAIPVKITERELKEKKLILSLSVFQDELECALIDVFNNTVYLSGSYVSAQRKFSDNELLFLLNDFISRYQLSSYITKNILVIYSAPRFTLCPAEFYIPEKKTVLLNFTHPPVNNEVVLTSSYDGIKAIYGMPQSIQRNLLQVFPSAHLMHSSVAMMNIFYHHPLLLHSKIWIHIHSNYIEVIAKHQNKFLFYNTFDIQTTVDILYYILFSIQQVHLKAKETDVFLSGNISLQHTIFQLLRKYVHSVQLLHHHPKLHILPVNSLLMSHYHFITLNYYLCGLYQENIKEEK